MAMAASCDTVNQARATIGLAPVDSMGTLLDRAERVVVTSPAELDAPVDGIPGNVRYVGPVFEPAASDAGWTPPPGDDPLVVVSLGTTPMDEVPVLQAILDGLARAPVRVLVMCGDHLAEDDLSLPPNATRTGYVRHGAVLPHADLVIDHAGLGTRAGHAGPRAPAAVRPARPRPTGQRRRRLPDRRRGRAGPEHRIRRARRGRARRAR